MDFGRVLETVATFFDREGFCYAVIGAFGLHACGRSRATLDAGLPERFDEIKRLA